MSRRSLPAALALCIFALLGLAGCTPGPTWNADMGAVSTSQLTALLKSTDASALRDVPVAEAPERRNHALASLRGEKDGSQVADVLTSTFPQDTGGVPLYVGLGTYANQKAIVVIEAYGARGGVLDHKRLWVLTTTGSPLYSSSSK